MLYRVFAGNGVVPIRGVVGFGPAAMFSVIVHSRTVVS